MEDKKIWLSSPHLGGHEQKYIQEAFDTNWITSKGANIDGFEKDLENYLGEKCFVGALNSGTAAIHLGLVLLGVKEGDEVLCQSMTFVASVNPILYLGATPVLIDSEKETWNICPKALEEAIIDRIKKGKKPKVIIAVHLYGMPYKIEEIRAVSLKYGIPILEDSAEAIGSGYKSQKCGTFGDLSVFSFNGNKIITTSGGGALVTKDYSVKERTVFLATQARDNTSHYQHSEVGYNYRMSNVCAGIGRGQMEVLEKHVNLRREMNRFYTDLFASIEGVTILKEPSVDYFSNFWLSTVLIDPQITDGIDCEDLRLGFEADNIESRPLWKPMHLQPIFEKYPYYGSTIAEDLFKKGLCLPSGSNLTKDDKARISEVILSLFQK